MDCSLLESLPEFNYLCSNDLDFNENIEKITDHKYIDFSSIEKNDYELENKNEIEVSKKMTNSLSRTLTKEEKKNRRKMKNCISARKAQLKKRKYTEILEYYIVYLENENNALKKSNLNGCI